DAASRELDFSTCFEHTVLYNVPSVILLLVGLPRIAYLAKRPTRFAPNAFLYGQLALLACLAGLAIAQATLVADGSRFDTSLLVALVVSAASLIASVPIQYLEHVKVPAPSTLLSVTLFFRVLAAAIALHTYIRAGIHTAEPAFFALFATTAVLSLLAMVATSLDQGRGESGDLEENTASPFAKFSFAWLFPMLVRANRATLDMDAISATSKLLRMERLDRTYHLLTDGSSKNHANLILFGTLRMYWPVLVLAVMSAASSIVAAFISPRLLTGLLGFVEAYSDQAPTDTVLPPVSDGLLFAVGMFVMSILATMGLVYSYQLSMLVYQRVRLLLQTAIYRKALVMSLSERKDSSVGEIVNRMSVDTNDMVQAILSLNDIWIFPVKIALAMYFLYTILGFAAFAGLAVLFLVGPVGGAAASVFSTQTKIKMGIMDGRVKVLNEMISGMKSVKLLVLEDFFKRKVVALRDSEQAALRRMHLVLSAVV
ncbi:ABC transporter transmembrane region-domain-containing protein, partial [Blastocladiella britannica]